MSESIHAFVLVALLSRIPVERLTLMGCRTLSASKLRTLLRHLSLRDSRKTIIVDITDSPDLSGSDVDIPRLMNLAKSAGVSLIIH
jgi:hypothetical protein